MYTHSVMSDGCPNSCKYQALLAPPRHVKTALHPRRWRPADTALSAFPQERALVLRSTVLQSTSSPAPNGPARRATVPPISPIVLMWTSCPSERVRVRGRWSRRLPARRDGRSQPRSRRERTCCRSPDAAVTRRPAGRCRPGPWRPAPPPLGHGTLLRLADQVPPPRTRLRDPPSHPRSRDLDRRHLSDQQPPHPLAQFTDALLRGVPPLADSGRRAHVRIRNRTPRPARITQMRTLRRPFSHSQSAQWRRCAHSAPVRADNHGQQRSDPTSTTIAASNRSAGRSTSWFAGSRQPAQTTCSPSRPTVT